MHVQHSPSPKTCFLQHLARRTSKTRKIWSRQKLFKNSRVKIDRQRKKKQTPQKKEFSYLPEYTPASWILLTWLKTIDFLVGNSKEVNMLRKKFIFKIVSVLNPDRVIYGNYRCSLQEWTWTEGGPSLTNFCILRFIMQKSCCRLSLRRMKCWCSVICTHSIKKEAFMCGCCSSGNGVSEIQANVHPPDSFSIYPTDWAIFTYWF